METAITTLLTVGLACLIAAIIGGGLKAFGLDLPILTSLGRQIMLGLAGAVLVALSLGLSSSGPPAAAVIDLPAKKVGFESLPVEASVEKIKPSAKLPAKAASAQPPPTEETPAQKPMMPAYTRFDYESLDGSVSGVFIKTATGWAEKNTQLTFDRKWTLLEDSLVDLVKLKDGHAFIEISPANGRIYYTDPGWPDYPARKPIYRITKAR